MKKIFVCLVALLTIQQVSLAQNIPFKVSAEPIAPGKTSQQVNWSLSLNQAVAVGLMTEQNVPANIVLLDAKLNGKKLWLKMSPELPKKKDAVHWYTSNRRLVLLFAPGQLTAGARLEVAMIEFYGKIMEADQMNLDVFTLKADKNKVQKNRLLASQNIKIIEK